MHKAALAVVIVLIAMLVLLLLPKLNWLHITLCHLEICFKVSCVAKFLGLSTLVFLVF